MKRCMKCKTVKPYTEYGKLKSSSDGYYFYCKPCVKSNSKKNYEKHKNKINIYSRKYYKKVSEDPGYNRARYVKKHRNNHLIKKYGITEEKYREISKAQNNACAICKKSELDEKNKLAVDHDHDSGKVRGLLCRDCNTGIGHFKDNIDLLNMAINYLILNKIGNESQ
jgi:Recombination endonuclease VII